MYISNYIDGALKNSLSNFTLPNIDPSIGTEYGTLPDSDENDAIAAIESAQKAQSSWAALSIEERSSWLTKIADAIEAKSELFARSESIDNGKPVHVARSVDIPRAVSNFRFFSHAITQFSSESYTSQGSIHYVLRQSLGVVVCISPWNLPLYLFTWKIAPALAMGNTVVAKPSEVTPATAYLLSQVCMEIGLPAGVLNIIHGRGDKLGPALCTHPKVKAISFTGGTFTGAKIASLAAPLFKKLSLELGGKNPTIIYADCDYEEMLNTVVRSSFSNQGQICLCGSRILIERSIYEKFKTDFVTRVKQLKVGDPQLEDTLVGAIVSEQHMQKVLSYIDISKSEGGIILTGGHRVKIDGRCNDGYFIAPTIIEGLSKDCRTNQEEIFGPVVTLTPFDNEPESIEIANCTSYGLAASIWTTNINKAHRVAEKVEAGIVWINCWMVRDLRVPFGGVKNSGVGREGGQEVMRFMSDAKTVTVKL
jgi:aminomuconate-semialdehyde/2-hydroxymuconate-6-semialdehyde dehydrogenase